ncbi:DUF6701 domain-containing protein [Pleionea sediminis]|uniref:DUF6701 domain-containing protein n=1 Tax=Pleionea sediminis TaxID=2569479 RepID=UPI0011851258|nr:DUF6701 domain-containing protein [Pleionea sediminis]
MNRTLFRSFIHYSTLIVLATLSLATTPLNSAIVFSDDFESNLNQWTENSSGGDASIGNETSNSGSNSLRLRWDTVTITSDAINASSAGAQLSFWVRRGDDAFSENPETNENLIVEYLNSSSVWTNLETYAGGGTPGEEFNYNQALPADALYNGLQIRFRLTQGSGTDFDYWHIDDVIIDTLSSSAPTGLVAEWRFDELSWSSSQLEVRDSSGNGYHGIAFNSQPTAGLICNSADFTAAGTEDYIRLNNESLNGLDDWTISVWVTSNRDAAQTILSASKNETELNEAVMYFDDASTFWPSVRSNPFFDNNTQITLPYAINDGDFHHLAWTRDLSQSETCIYLDSALVGCTTHADGGNTMDVIVDGLVIGQEQDVVGGDFDINQVWVGLIDELLLFDNELSAGEVLFIYDNQLAGRNWDGSERVCPETPPSSTAYWRMDESEWTGGPNEIIDYSGNGLDLTAFGGADTGDIDPAIVGSPGTCGYGEFDGSATYLQIDHDPLLSFSTNMSITLWMKPNAIPGTGLSSLVSKDENYEFHLNSSGEIYWWWQQSSLTTSGANIQAGNWYHIGITFEDGEQKIYVNGIELASSNWSGTLPQNTDPLQVGQDQLASGRFFNGLIDEVRIFNNTLSHGQVVQTMLQVHPCTGSSICPFDYTDNFNVQSYGNNDGTKNFAGNWQESGDNNNPNSGDIRITGGYLRVQNTDRNEPSIQRTMDLSQAIDAELRVDLRTSNQLENNDRFVIEASDDGVSFVSLSGEIRNDRVGVFTYDLTPYISANTTIRLRVTQGYFNNNEYMEFDSIQVSVTENCGVSYFVINHDGSGINCLREAISITAFDGNNNILTGYDGTAFLSTTTSNGNWFTTDSSGASSDLAQGTLNDTANDDNGSASYQFTPADLGTVTLYFEDTHEEAVNLTVIDGSAIDDNTEGSLTFRPFGFVVTPSPINTEIAGRSFDVQLTAAGQTPTQPECGVIEEYTGTKTINFWSSYVLPVTSPTELSVNGASIATSEATSTSQNVEFTNGVSTLTVNYNDVGQISFAAKDDVGIGDPTSGNSDEVIGGISPFVVRPFGYDLQPQGNPNATDANSSIYSTAAVDFNLTLRSVLWQSSDDADNNGQPDAGANLSDNGITPNIVNLPASATDINLSATAQVVTNNNGTLGDSNITFSEFGSVGSASQGEVNMLQNWSEVGIMTLDAVTSDFLSSGASVSGTRSNIGRFIPASFLLSVTNDFEAQCTGFTYAGFDDGNPGLSKSGQSDNITINIQALNQNGAATNNYDDGFAKLEAGTINLNPFNVDTSAAASGSLVSDSLPTPIFDTNGAAANVVITNVNYQYPALDDIFNLRVDINATDSDGVTGAVSSSSVEQRLGRLQIQTSYGSELETLQIPLFTEYFSSSGWTINNADNCTSYIDSNLAFIAGTYRGNLNSGETSVTFPATPAVVNTGRSEPLEGFWLAAPGLGNSGEVDVEYDLSLANWLYFDWNGDGTTGNPQSTAGFGLYRGSDRIIYWKEN